MKQLSRAHAHILKLVICKYVSLSKVLYKRTDSISASMNEALFCEALALLKFQTIRNIFRTSIGLLWPARSYCK